MNNDDELKYTEYIAGQLNKTLQYTEYLAEHLDKNIQYSEYLSGTHYETESEKAERIRLMRSKKLNRIINEMDI